MSYPTIQQIAQFILSKAPMSNFKLNQPDSFKKFMGYDHTAMVIIIMILAVTAFNQPQLKPTDEDKIGTEYIRDANNFINGEYNLDITDNIEKIIKWIPNEETTVKRKLTRLYTC